MCPVVGSDRPEAPVPNTVVMEEELIVAASLRPQGRLPMRSALLHPAEAEYTPPLKDRYWSR